MRNPSAIKLALVFDIGLADATKLVEAGFTNPRKVYNATDEQLGVIVDVGKLAKVRERKAKSKK